MTSTALPEELVDQIVSVTFASYAALSFRPQPTKFTILASFVLVHHADLPETSRIQVISLGTGSKCLPENRLPVSGDALHDCHAEVLARRGAIRWLAQEVMRDYSVDSKESDNSQEESKSQCRSLWICRESYDNGKYRLRDGVKLVLYVSTVSCKTCMRSEQGTFLTSCRHHLLAKCVNCMFSRRRRIYPSFSLPPRPNHGLSQGRHLLARSSLRHPLQGP